MSLFVRTKEQEQEKKSHFFNADKKSESFNVNQYMSFAPQVSEAPQSGEEKEMKPSYMSRVPSNFGSSRAIMGSDTQITQANTNFAFPPSNSGMNPDNSIFSGFAASPQNLQGNLRPSSAAPSNNNLGSQAIIISFAPRPGSIQPSPTDGSSSSFRPNPNRVKSETSMCQLPPVINQDYLANIPSSVMREGEQPQNGQNFHQSVSWTDQKAGSVVGQGQTHPNLDHNQKVSGQRKWFGQGQMSSEQSQMVSGQTLVASGQSQMVPGQAMVASGQGHLVSESRGEGRLVDLKKGQPQIVDIKVGNSYEVSRNVIIDPNVRIRENHLPTKEVRSSFSAQVTRKEVQAVSQKALINERIVEKNIDVIVEKPVPVYKEVERRVDVFIEKPIEKIIEKEVITEIIMEKKVDKVVEVPFDRVVEVPIERIIDQPVLVNRFVDVPREVFVDRPVERIIQNPIFNDRVIEIDEKDIPNYKADVILPTKVMVFEKEVVKEMKRSMPMVRERPVEVPVEVIVKKPVPRQVDVPVERIIEKPTEVINYIEKIVEVPVDKIVYKKVEKIVEEPEYITNIIQRRVPVEKIVEVPYEVIEEVEVINPIIVPTTHYVPKVMPSPNPIISYSSTHMNHKTTNVKEVIKENVIRREIPKIVQQEVIYEVTVPVEKVKVVEEIVEVPIDRIIERPVIKEVIKYIDVEVEKEFVEENIVEDIRYNEKVVKVNVEKIVEKPIVRTNIIEKPIFIEKIVEKEVLVPVEKIIEVPVDKIVEVPIEVIIEKPILIQKQVFREVFYNKSVPKISAPREGASEDPFLKQRVEQSSRELNQTKVEVAKLKAEWDSLNRRQSGITIHANTDYTAQNAVLKKKIQELAETIDDTKKGRPSRKSLFEDRSTMDNSFHRPR